MSEYFMSRETFLVAMEETPAMAGTQAYRWSRDDNKTAAGVL